MKLEQQDMKHMFVVLHVYGAPTVIESVGFVTQIFGEIFLVSSSLVD